MGGNSSRALHLRRRGDPALAVPDLPPLRSPQWPLPHSRLRNKVDVCGASVAASALALEALEASWEPDLALIPQTQTHTRRGCGQRPRRSSSSSSSRFGAKREMTSIARERETHRILVRTRPSPRSCPRSWNRQTSASMSSLFAGGVYAGFGTSVGGSSGSSSSGSSSGGGSSIGAVGVGSSNTIFGSSSLPSSSPWGPTPTSIGASVVGGGSGTVGGGVGAVGSNLPIAGVTPRAFGAGRGLGLGLGVSLGAPRDTARVAAGGSGAGENSGAGSSIGSGRTGVKRSVW